MVANRAIKDTHHLSLHPVTVPHYLRLEKKWHKMHLGQRGEAICSTGMTTVSFFPMWFVVSLSNLCLPCTLTSSMLERGSWERRQTLQQTSENYNHSTEILQRRQEFPESPFHQTSNYNGEGKKRKE